VGTLQTNVVSAENIHCRSVEWLAVLPLPAIQIPPFASCQQQPVAGLEMPQLERFDALTFDQSPMKVNSLPAVNQFRN